MQRLVRWIMLAAFWTLLGLFFVSETYLASAVMGRPVTWDEALLSQLPGWYIWALLSPLVVALGRRVRIRRENWTFGVIFHATASALFSLVHIALAVAAGAAFGAWSGHPVSFLRVLRFLLESGSHLNLLAYWAILGASYALDYYRRDRERELRASQLQGRLAQAQLQMLKMEMNPHFLFNTLNAVSALMHKDVDAAERMLARLAELLRLTLDTSGKQEVALRDELEFLRKYVEIEQTRFRERLVVNIDVAGETLDASVPNLVLQPLVENAIRHGIAPRASAGKVDVSVQRTGDRLEMAVRDNGPGIGTSASAGAGVGLSNTRARLEHLYGADHEFEIGDVAGGGVQVRLVIPFRVAQPAGQSA